MSDPAEVLSQPLVGSQNLAQPVLTVCALLRQAQRQNELIFLQLDTQTVSKVYVRPHEIGQTIHSAAHLLKLVVYKSLSVGACTSVPRQPAPETRSGWRTSLLRDGTAWKARTFPVTAAIRSQNPGRIV